MKHYIKLLAVRDQYGHFSYFICLLTDKINLHSETVFAANELLIEINFNEFARMKEGLKMSEMERRTTEDNKTVIIYETPEKQTP